jgi:hypothetical protein
VYGIVEMTNFHAAADIDATYGGIDAPLRLPVPPVKSNHQLRAIILIST